MAISKPAIDAIICAATISAAIPVAAAPSTSGIVCVPLDSIEDSPAVDAKTVLLKLRGGEYKRVDLIDTCSEILFRGFHFVSHTWELCTTNRLEIVEPGHPECMIKDIIDITPDEARALQKKATR